MIHPGAVDRKRHDNKYIHTNAERTRKVKNDKQFSASSRKDQEQMNKKHREPAPPTARTTAINR
jgi:hypothetical protein